MRSLAILPLLLASSCGSAATTYVGAVDGTDVAVGLVTDGSHVALFFCGGASSYATSTKWFRFASSSDAFDQTEATWHATGSLVGPNATGTLDRGDGQTLTWSAARVDDGSVEGLYESITSSGTAGVVVRSASDGQGAFVHTSLTVEQIVPIFPLDLEPAGLHVTISGADAFVPRATAE